MPDETPHSDPRQPVNPASLSIEDMSRLLSAAGGRKVTVAQVRDDIDAGAPVPDIAEDRHATQKSQTIGD